MRARVEQNAANADADEGYIDGIGLKTISEMAHPMISPYTGHIYDKVDIVQWVSDHGTDPIVGEKLTVPNLISGRFVKQINDEFNGKLSRMERTIQAIRDDNARAAQATRDAHEINIQEVRREAREDSDRRVEDFKNANQQLIDNLTHLITVTAQANITLTAEKKQLTTEKTHVIEENMKLSVENMQLRVENKDLKANVNHVNPVWNKYGHKIDCKLHKGSTPERTEALKAYKDKVTASLTDKELEEAVNDLGPLKEPKIARRNSFFFPSLGISTTLKLASKLQEEVNADKGFVPPQPQ